MIIHADSILSSVSDIWDFADRDSDTYETYRLGEEMSAVYHLVSRAHEILVDLSSTISEEVEEEDGDDC